MTHLNQFLKGLKLKSANIQFSTQSVVIIDEFNAPTPTRINLSTTGDLRREMARVYREARAGVLPTTEATKLMYMLGQLLKAHELVVIEERINQLEARQ